MLSAHRENLFDVLDLPESATPMEAERSGQRLLGLLAAGHKPSARFSTWSGQAERTEDLVRQAMQASKDPAQLLLHAFWKQSLQKLDSSRRGRTLAGELRLLTASECDASRQTNRLQISLSDGIGCRFAARTVCDSLERLAV